MTNPGHRERAPRHTGVNPVILALRKQACESPFFCLALCAAALAADKPEWDNPAIVHIGTEKPHATMMVYPIAELARTGDRAKSPWFQLLNGTWKFHGSLRPAERPLDFYRPDFNDAAWGTMPVPASWQMHGFDIPIYTNIIYPWPQDASKPPAGAVRIQPRRQLPHALHRAARLEGPPGLPALRRRGFRLLRLGERQEARLQRGQPHARRVRSHAAPEARHATCWPWRSTASATAPSWKTRTCGA